MNSVSFTYRRRSTPKYYVCCVTRQYLFRIHFFASQRLSEGPAYLYNYIYLLLSSFFSQIQVFRRSLSQAWSRLFTTKYYVTKRKSLQCFDQRISGVMNGPLKFLTARKILPLLDLLAKFKRVLACSCSPNFCSCSHARFLVSIARNFVNPSLG